MEIYPCCNKIRRIGPGTELCCSGPVEHLLSTRGQEYISLAEQQAATDPKFARMMKGVWRTSMSEDVWDRVCEIQCRMGVYYNRGFIHLDKGHMER